MKFNHVPRSLAFAVGLISTLGLSLATTFAQGTAFTYQGRLNDGATPATGRYDLRFAIFDALTVGAQQGGLVTNAATTVSNGLFTVTLDFGNQFPGASRWLEIAVRTNGAASFFTLSPRQALTPAPYAITAGTVISGGLTAGTYGNAVAFNNANNAFAGAFTGNGAKVTNVNAATLNGLTSDGFWRTNGNAGANPVNGTFIGTTDNQPLVFKVNTNRALRLEYAYDTNYPSVAPNLIGGFAGNVVSNGFVGASILGGGNAIWPNLAGADYASVLGGIANCACGFSSTAMGYGTTASGNFSTTMGSGTTASGGAAVAMGYRALALHNGTFVWSDVSYSDFSSTARNQFLIRASGGVGINMNNPDGASLYVQGGRTNGWPNSVGWFENTNSTGISAPALRVVDDGGNATDGALSVSANGTGLIARFGNAYNWVADIQTNGTVDAVVFNPTSDRNAKEHFTPVNPRAVLEKVTTMPISEWNYKLAAGIRHVGPMAQDFQAAFNLGADDKHIATVDADGVALAAIQGLNQKLEEQHAENAELRQKLAELKQLVQTLVAKH